MRNRDLARRVAAVESRAPPPRLPLPALVGGPCVELAPGVGIWPPWEKLLSAEEWAFLARLLPRASASPCPPPGGDYLAEYRAICRDGGERAMLETIAAKEPPGTPLSTYPCCSLRVMLVELAGLLLRGDEDGAD